MGAAEVFPWGRCFFFIFYYYFLNFWANESPKSSKNGSPSFYSFYLFIWEGKTFVFFSSVMMIFSVIITFSFYSGFSLSSVVLSLLWDGPPDFWHWVDKWCNFSFKVFYFCHYVDWGCNLPSCFITIFKRPLLIMSEVVLRRPGHYQLSNPGAP